MPNGIILVDKPPNLTSGELTRKIEKIFGEKAGHTGILDPKVSGLMLILVGKARKLAKFLFGMDKEYEGIMYIHKEVKKDELEKVIKKFEGEILQLPPRKSKVARVLRKRKVHYFKILKIEGKNVYFRVRCEAGTYIRKLCHDIGEKLGVGAHMKYLRRIKVGDFDVKEAVKLEKLEKEEKPEKYLIPLEKLPMLLGFSIAEIDENIFKKAKHGTPLKINEIKFSEKKENLPLAIYYKKKLVGIGKTKKDRIYWECVLLTN